eukprot:TRINITY_DN52347_c0_g1_i1.p1 TRINITY_DN52347_c0_g1~~TRINITY_DN52347_c0_g1_i1.p1  ORF type:complete len:239 (-),score=35.50 TRINITY_DN52347_c0_g1_i1:28-705(-)
MRIARAPLKIDKASRFDAAVCLLQPDEPKLRSRKQDANDSGSMWQVVHRQAVPVDIERGPWLPVPDLLPKKPSDNVLQNTDAMKVNILPSKEELPLQPSGGVRRPGRLPWEASTEEYHADRGSVQCGRGLRRAGRTSCTPPASRPKGGGQAFWDRISTPRGQHRELTLEQKGELLCGRAGWLHKQNDTSHVEGGSSLLQDHLVRLPLSAREARRRGTNPRTLSRR